MTVNNRVGLFIYVFSPLFPFPLCFSLSLSSRLFDAEKEEEVEIKRNLIEKYKLWTRLIGPIFLYVQQFNFIIIIINNNSNNK